MEIDRCLQEELLEFAAERFA